MCRNQPNFNHFASVDVYTRKTFPNCKTEDVYVHDLWRYSRNSYSNFGRHAIFSESSGSRLEDRWQKALQTMIEPALFVDFCLIPLSNTCSFVRPARNVNREIFLHCQEGFCVGKFGLVVDQAVLDNRPLRKHFRRSRLCCKRQALLKIYPLETQNVNEKTLLFRCPYIVSLTWKIING